MAILVACCVLLLVLTTVTHYEVLRLLSFGLPTLRVPARAKLIIVIVAAFGSHAFQMLTPTWRWSGSGMERRSVVRNGRLEGIAHARRID